MHAVPVVRSTLNVRVADLYQPAGFDEYLAASDCLVPNFMFLQVGEPEDTRCQDCPELFIAVEPALQVPL